MCRFINDDFCSGKYFAGIPKRNFTTETPRHQEISNLVSWCPWCVYLLVRRFPGLPLPRTMPARSGPSTANVTKARPNFLLPAEPRSPSPTPPPVQVNLSNLLYLSLSPPVTNTTDAQVVGTFTPQQIGKTKGPAQATFSHSFYNFKGNRLASTSPAPPRQFPFLLPAFLWQWQELVARVDDVSAGNVRTGLMIRKRKTSRRAPNPSHSSSIPPENLSLRVRAKSNERSTLVAAGKVTVPVYLRLLRMKNQSDGYKSLDGKVWNLVGRVYQEDKTAKDDNADKTLGIDMPWGTLARLSPLPAAWMRWRARQRFDQVLVRPEYAPPAAEAAAVPGQFIATPLEWGQLKRGCSCWTGTFLADAWRWALRGRRQGAVFPRGPKLRSGALATFPSAAAAGSRRRRSPACRPETAAGRCPFFRRFRMEGHLPDHRRPGGSEQRDAGSCHLQIERRGAGRFLPGNGSRARRF